MTASRIALPLALALSVGLMAAMTGAADANNLVGRWQTPSEQGYIDLYECGSKICGRGVPTEAQKAGPDVKDVKNHDPALRNRSLNGLEILHDFAGGPTVWTGGAIYRPADGNTYSGKLELLDSSTMRMTGCVMAPLCKSYVWKKVP